MLSAVALALLLSLLYESLAGYSFVKDLPAAYFRWMIYLILACLAALIFRLPRWSLYGGIIMILLTHLFTFTQIVSKFDHDNASTRDDAAESTAGAFIQGLNPWNNIPELGVEATTGPLGVLYSVPFVFLFGEINWLAFLLWTIMFLILLIGDIRTENATFPLLTLLFVIGISGFGKTLFWSLDELYFSFLFFPLAAWSATRKHYFLTGVLLACPLLARLNYVIIIFGFLGWLLFKERISLRDLLKMGLGAVLAAGIILLPFILVGGREFLAHNPFTLAIMFSQTAAWPADNIIFRALNFLSRNTGPAQMQWIKLGIILAGLLISSVFLRAVTHPFWHMAIAGLLAQTFGWFSRFPVDYQLMFMIPAFMAVAFTPLEIQIKKTTSDDP